MRCDFGLRLVYETIKYPSPKSNILIVLRENAYCHNITIDYLYTVIQYIVTSFGTIKLTVGYNPHISVSSIIQCLDAITGLDLSTTLYSDTEIRIDVITNDNAATANDTINIAFFANNASLLQIRIDMQCPIVFAQEPSHIANEIFKILSRVSPGSRYRLKSL